MEHFVHFTGTIGNSSLQSETPIPTSSSSKGFGLDDGKEPNRSETLIPTSSSSKGIERDDGEDQANDQSKHK